MTTIEIPEAYGYVVMTGALSVLVTTFLGIQVTLYRNEAKVPLPFLYAEKSEVEKDEKKMIFNCYQRAHQNSLETQPQVLFMLAMTGLKYPLFASGVGLVWVIGRIFFASGYQTGRPANRSRGGFGHFAYFTLIGSTIVTAFSILFY
ncbi:1202_t:CDS:2 [Ambispora gerdemannii]|uniref:Glutathione S-transferase 3, mitochondrial n=1 Tax=Ambispora gerdemannii TaxID=144530 RepID=A0A9N8UVY7_9GLOM|nr:1202_t:CDS:2 [Ambispora gerdemannii]